MNTKLYIENQEIELKDEVQFLLNKQFEDITNPTVIINDWSKTVEIPSTQHNDEVFGHIYSPDRIIVEEANPSVLVESSYNKATTAFYVPTSTYYNTTFESSLNRSHIVMTPTSSVPVGSFGYFNVYTGELPSSALYNTLVHERQIATSVSSGVVTFTFIASEQYVNNAIRFQCSGSSNYYPSFTLANGINHTSFEPGKTYTVTFDFQRADWGSTANIYLDFYVSVKLVEYDYKHFGVYFDPYRKLDFRLEWNDSTVMEGYAKLNEIKRTGSKTVYSMILNGTLGKVFQELKKITFDKALLNSEDSQYVIPGWYYYKERMSRNLVYNSWVYSRSHNSLNNARPDEIIGWAVNNAFSDDFDHKSFVASDDLTIKQFKDVLPSDFQSATRIDPASLLENGLKPRDIGEFRSYNQLPFYYWDMFWYIFQAKAEQLTGYTWDCTDSWFHDNNPYWRYWTIKAQDFPLRTLSNYNTLEEQLNFEVITGGLNYIKLARSILGATGYLMSKQPPVSGQISKDNVSYDSATGLWSTSQYFTVNNNSTLRVWLTPLTIEVPYTGSETGKYGYLRFKQSQANVQLIVTAKLVDRDNETIEYGSKWWGYRLSDITFSQTWLDSGSSWISNSLPVPEYIDGVNSTLNTVNMRLKLTLELYSVEPGTLLEWVYDGAGGWMDYSGDLRVRTTNTAGVRKITTTELIRSYSQFDYNDLWNNDYNPFDFILNYCRMFRISVRVDDKEKKVIFKPIHKYLNEGDNSLDWTQKVDYSKDFVIKPISWENRYIKFNYEENDLKDNKKYLEKYGVNYGELKIQTEYKFNSETTDLFSNVNSVMEYTPYVNSWNNLYNKLITYILPSEWYTENVDLDNKQQNLFGYFGFVQYGAYSFNQNYGLSSCCITDDHYQEITTEHYCYNQTNQDRLDVGQYRTIEDYYYNQASSLKFYATFNVPMEIYYKDQPANNNYDIYTLFWQRYIEERYDRNNKVVTCYVKLDSNDFQNFEFNKFVNIDNQLYFVNRIFDFNLTSNEPTKVELITIQDPEAYRTNIYDEIL